MEKRLNERGHFFNPTAANPARAIGDCILDTVDSLKALRYEVLGLLNSGA